MPDQAADAAQDAAPSPHDGARSLAALGSGIGRKLTVAERPVFWQENEDTLTDGVAVTRLPDEDWFKVVLESYQHPPTFTRDIQLPGFPSDEIQAATTGASGYHTLREAFIFYSDCRQHFASAGKPLVSGRSLLDFGTGWGRVLRFFINDLDIRDLFGTDVTPGFIDICRTTFRTNNFIVNKPFPPTPIPSERFDYIVGYSVFSHLSEAACAAWMAEFHRILVPGGLLALTTRGRPFFDICEDLRQQEVSGYAKAMSMIFDDFDEARCRYDRGEFVHSSIPGVGGGGSMNSTFYGETFIPKKYAQEAYKHQFELQNFTFDPPRQTHPIMFFIKR